MPLLIPGPTDPTKDLHVYLRPLIDELKVLWHAGVETYDMFSRTNFIMKAALLWTISDFPGLAMLSGWSTKGKLSCPVCMGEVKGKQLKHGGKISFYGTARYFLESDDPLRRSTKFGSVETRSVCARHSGGRAKVMCEQIQFPHPGKSHKKKPRNYRVKHNWTHFSPFFELPYWETLSLRHNIDIMHTEKNVFDNIFYTILGDGKKTKDNTKLRKDCQELRVHRELWIRGDGTEPHAPYTLSKEQIHKLFKWIESLKRPDGYASNISRCVNWAKNCIRVLKNSDLEKMEKDIVRIMSKLETVFTPDFFDPMEHLPLHLATECKLGGPANGRWMYFIERYLHNLKLKVGNKARAEGSMAQRYIEEECVHFCTLYFDSKKGIMRNKLRRNEAPRMFHDDNLLEVYTYPTHPSLRTKDKMFSGDEYELVAYYVLINSPEVAKYLRGFQKLVERQYPHFNDAEKEKFQKEQFRDWFERRVKDDEKFKEKFIDLIRGPLNKVESYKACKCNGYKFDCVNTNELTSPNSDNCHRNKINDEALQNEVSNASSSHVEKVIVRDPLNFFIDLRMFENDYSMDDNEEEENKKDEEDEDEDTNENDNDELSDNDDLVVWAGPKSRKGKEDMGGEESFVEGTKEVGESSRKIIFERKRRNCSEGDYSRKSAPDARPTIHFLLNEKGFLKNTPKKTLGHIVRMKFDEDTIWTKGASREAFYNSCIKNFKEYYAYPFPYDDEDGDQVVRAYLHRNWKSYLGAERSRLVDKVKQLLECGYTENDFNIRDEGLKPYYYSQRTWNSMCDYWEDESFKNMSTNSQIARSKVEFVSRSGAKSFEQRRQEINEEREARGELPISEDEFMGMVYDPTQPVVQNLQMMSEILDVVWEMVRSLPTREVKQTILDEEVRKLAYVALPDPSQQSLHSQYIRAVTGLLGPILEKNDKIIIEEVVPTDQVVDNSDNNGDEVRGGNEDEDLDAHNYPLI
ncbi:hypothetical protein AgCh_008075 [Apium graveolens]